MKIPAFSGDTSKLLHGGDLMLQVCAETSAAAREVTASVLAKHFAKNTVHWQQTGYRDAPTAQGVTRTSLGFLDGIINPREQDMLAEGVWTGPEQDTYVVFRRMNISPNFLALSVQEQEQAIGRKKATGEPLSGGQSMDQIDLFAKSQTGKTLIASAAHTRRAHPAHVGRPLMLRRSYSIDVAQGAGLLFCAFLNDPQTFVVTQRRLDEMDDLIKHTTTDASGCFFIPGDLGK